MIGVDYKEWWDSMEWRERIKFIENKFAYYRSLDYQVGEFRNQSYIADKDDKTITWNKMSYHELKTIYAMDEYLEGLK